MLRSVVTSASRISRLGTAWFDSGVGITSFCLSYWGYSRLQNRLRPLSLKKKVNTDHLVHFWLTPYPRCHPMYSVVPPLKAAIWHPATFLRPLTTRTIAFGADRGSNFFDLAQSNLKYLDLFLRHRLYNVSTIVHEHQRFARHQRLKFHKVSLSRPGPDCDKPRSIRQLLDSVFIGESALHSSSNDGFVSDKMVVKHRTVVEFLLSVSQLLLISVKQGKRARRKPYWVVEAPTSSWCTGRTAI